MRKLFLGITLALFVCLPAANAAEPAPIKPAPQIGSALPELGTLTQKTVLSLGALTLLFLLVTGTFKRIAKARGTTKTEHEIHLLARRPIGQRQALLLVAINGQKFFLSQGSEEIRLISELDDRSIYRSAMEPAALDLFHETEGLEPRKLANEDLT